MKKKKFDLAQKFFSFRVVLRLRRIIVAPPILVQSKNFSPKSYYLSITNNEIGLNSKSKQKILIFVYLKYKKIILKVTLDLQTHY
jgi:hypothetical protein